MTKTDSLELFRPYSSPLSRVELPGLEALRRIGHALRSRLGAWSHAYGGAVLAALLYLGTVCLCLGSLLAEVSGG